MDGYRLDLSSPPDWRPLERLSLLLVEAGWSPVLNASDFMYMGRMVSLSCPPIHLYKHQVSRTYLSLDALGHCHRLLRAGDALDARTAGLASSLDRLHPSRKAATEILIPLNAEHADTTQSRPTTGG